MKYFYRTVLLLNKKQKITLKKCNNNILTSYAKKMSVFTPSQTLTGYTTEISPFTYWLETVKSDFIGNYNKRTVVYLQGIQGVLDPSRPSVIMHILVSKILKQIY